MDHNPSSCSISTELLVAQSPAEVQTESTIKTIHCLDSQTVWNLKLGQELLSCRRNYTLNSNSTENLYRRHNQYSLHFLAIWGEVDISKPLLSLAQDIMSVSIRTSECYSMDCCSKGRSQMRRLLVTSCLCSCIKWSLGCLWCIDWTKTLFCLIYPRLPLGLRHT